MKLLTKYNRVNLVTTIIVMLITGIIYYQAISYILTGIKDQDLVVEEREVFDYVKLNHELPQTFESNDQQITFTPARQGTVKREFINTEYYKKFEGHHGHRRQGEYEAGRGLISSVTVGDKYY